MKKIILALVGLLIVLVAIMAWNASTLESHQLTEFPEPAAFEIDEKAVIARFSESIRFETISYEPGKVNYAAFRAFHGFLFESFPSTFSTLETEFVSGLTLLMTWHGSNPGLDPILLMAHQDVVPADYEDQWTYPPFSGKIVDGVVYGRGAVDNKNGVMGILEAVEMLIDEGFRPERTVMLMFGHDEEVGGTYGAVKVASLLTDRGIRPAFVLDEGGFVHPDAFDAGKPVALVGTSEKGYLSLELISRAESGHSSMPPFDTAIGNLTAAAERLFNNPFPTSMKGPIQDTFRYIVPELDFGSRFVLANQWITAPIVRRMLEASPETNAFIRTTTAPTMMWGSSKDNVLPAEAGMVINFRILPGETVETVIDRVKRVINDDRIEVRVYGFTSNPSPVSDPKSPEFALLHESIRQIFPDVYVVPFPMIAATDSRHFSDVSPNVFKFSPTDLNEKESVSFHGIDEQLRAEVYIRGIQFYRQLLLNTNGFGD